MSDDTIAPSLSGTAVPVATKMGTAEGGDHTTHLISKRLLIDMAAGGIGGLCVVLVGYPFDLLKTRLQTSTRPGTTLLCTIKHVWQTTGWRGFYQGVTAPLLGVSPIFAVNFYGYEFGQRLYRRLFPLTPTARTEPLSIASALLSPLSPPPSSNPSLINGRRPLDQCAFGAAFSALQTAAIVIPAERIKVFMQLPRSADCPLARLNALQVAHQLYREGGMRELYRGATTTLTRDLPGLVTFFTSYEVYKGWFCDPSVSPTDSLQSMSLVMFAGGLAGITSWMVSLPSDVVKSRLQAAHKEDALWRARFPTLLVLGTLLRQEGVLALYKGLVPVLLRAFPANAACFLGYEATKTTLSRLSDQ